jgi:hypothetical protein
MFPIIMDLFSKSVAELDRTHDYTLRRVKQTQQISFEDIQIISQDAINIVIECYIMLAENLRKIADECENLRESAENNLRIFELYKRLAALNDSQEEVSFEWMQ